MQKLPSRFCLNGKGEIAEGNYKETAQDLTDGGLRHLEVVRDWFLEGELLYAMSGAFDA